LRVRSINSARIGKVMFSQMLFAVSCHENIMQNGEVKCYEIGHLNRIQINILTNTFDSIYLIFWYTLITDVVIKIADRKYKIQNTNRNL